VVETFWERLVPLHVKSASWIGSSDQVDFYKYSSLKPACKLWHKSNSESEAKLKKTKNSEATQEAKNSESFF
jgi:hypothetical protein